MTARRYRLAKAEAQIPMPDRGGRLFAADAEGERVDPENRYYATLIADGDIVEISNSKPKGK